MKEYCDYDSHFPVVISVRECLTVLILANVVVRLVLPQRDHPSSAYIYSLVISVREWLTVLILAKVVVRIGFAEMRAFQLDRSFSHLLISMGECFTVLIAANVVV
jgi:hypothetical protein